MNKFLAEIPAEVRWSLLAVSLTLSLLAYCFAASDAVSKYDYAGKLIRRRVFCDESIPSLYGRIAPPARLAFEMHCDRRTPPIPEGARP